MNQFERNDNHIEIDCVINQKLNTQMIDCSLSIDGATMCIWNNLPFAIYILLDQSYCNKNNIIRGEDNKYWSLE